jgi:hypothetical protein
MGWAPNRKSFKGTNQWLMNRSNKPMLLQQLPNRSPRSQKENTELKQTCEQKREMKVLRVWLSVKRKWKGRLHENKQERLSF